MPFKRVKKEDIRNLKHQASRETGMAWEERRMAQMEMKK